jgi:quinol monooxygenase YgiN
MTQAFSFVVHCKIQDGQLEALRELMGELVASAQSEPGTLIYEWFLGDGGTTCHVLERYADSAAALLHVSKFGEQFAERFVALAPPTGVTVYGDPSPEVRGALDGFGATWLEPFGGFAR